MCMCVKVQSSDIIPSRDKEAFGTYHIFDKDRESLCPSFYRHEKVLPKAKFSCSSNCILFFSSLCNAQNWTAVSRCTNTNTHCIEWKKVIMFRICWKFSDAAVLQALCPRINITKISPVSLCLLLCCNKN